MLSIALQTYIINLQIISDKIYLIPKRLLTLRLLTFYVHYWLEHEIDQLTKFELVNETSIVV